MEVSANPAHESKAHRSVCVVFYVDPFQGEVYWLHLVPRCVLKAMPSLIPFLGFFVSLVMKLPFCSLLSLLHLLILQARVAIEVGAMVVTIHD